jgi:hypothetical protein
MVNRFLSRIFLASLLLLLGGLRPVVAEVQVNIDRNPIQVNESFQLIFSVDQSPDRDPDFSPLLQYFMILGNSRSNNISIINGEYQRSVKWTLKLMAKQIGEFMIPAIRFDKERSEPFQVTVQPSSLASVPHDQLVLELIVDKPVAYVQSQVVLTLRLLSAVNISAYEFGSINTGNLDTVVEALGDVRNYQTRIADKSYLVLEKKIALFPQQPGQLTVDPVIAEVRLPSNSSFDPFRTGGEIRQLRSQSLVIDVEPIPPAFSGSSWLPANRVELRQVWQGDLDKLVAGEPITRSLMIIADGLTAAQLPELVFPEVDGIKQYPDQAGLENSLTGKGISGRREQKVALIPGAPGSYHLPEISVPWWNLETGKMETATIPAREISVSSAPGSISDPVSGPDPVPGALPGAVPGALPQPSAALPAPLQANDFWFWLSLLLACGWALCAVYWWLISRRTGKPPQPVNELPDLVAARRQLRLSCDANDAVGARQALLPWGRALLAPREIDSLLQLGSCCGADLVAEIETLNLSLYAETRVPWRGSGLWTLCQWLENNRVPTDDSADAKLLPLNPAA